MNSQFSSIEMIKNQFGIDEESVSDMRTKLRSMQAALHPDKNKGSFIDEESASQYHQLDEAVSFIDSLNKSHSELVTISAVTALTKAVTAMVAAKSEVSDKNTLLSTEISRSITSYSSKLKAPRIALTAVTVTISAIWLFPKTVKEHPILSKLINFDGMTTTIAWLSTLFVFVGFWVITWRWEELSKEHRENLKTESVQNKLYRPARRTRKLVASGGARSKSEFRNPGIYFT